MLYPTSSPIPKISEITSNLGLTNNESLANKIDKLATSLLKEINQKKNLSQNRIKITATRKHIPLVYKMLEKAYNGYQSRKIVVEIKEPELEALKREYSINDQSYKPIVQGEFDLDEMHAYAQLSDQEITELEKSVVPQISEAALKELEVNTDEILDTCLNFKSDSNLLIKGYREHMPNIARLAKAAYKKGAANVTYELQEDKNYDFNIPFIKYANNQALKDDVHDQTEIAKYRYDQKVHTLHFDGADPEQKSALNGEQSTRYSTHMEEVNEARGKYWLGLIDIPWTRYFRPTVALAKKAGYDNFLRAAQHAKQATSNIKIHQAKQVQISKRLNELLDAGYRKLTFKSSDRSYPTNFSIQVPEHSPFISATITTEDGRDFIPNVPSRESFASPDWKTAEGTIYTTKPVDIDGQLVPEGTKIVFKDGEVVNYDDQGSNILGNWLKNKNAKKAGEIALVAESELKDLCEVMFNIIWDENVSSHLALGTSFKAIIPGWLNLGPDIQEELNSKLNSSKVHKDFMIGGPKVTVTMENTEDSSAEPLTLIKDDKYNREVFTDLAAS